MDKGSVNKLSWNGQVAFKPNASSSPASSKASTGPSEARIKGLATPQSGLVSRLQGASLTNMPPVSIQNDPYTVNHAPDSPKSPTLSDAVFSTEDSSSQGDVTSSLSSHTGEKDESIRPRACIIVEKLEEYIEAHWPMKDGEEERLRDLSLDDKWKMINEKVTRAPIFSAHHYAENLKNLSNKPRASHRQTGSSAKSSTWSLSSLLRKLKLDLKLSHDSFVKEFVRSPHSGIDKLVQILSSIQGDLTASTGTKSKIDTYKQATIDEYDCLLCIKFACGIEEGREELANSTKALEIIAPCFMNNQRKNTAIVIQILTLACSAPGGQNAVLDAMSHVRLKYGENVRFKMLIGMMNSQTDLRFKALCVKFFNSLVERTDNMNSRVYLQQELLLADFQPNALEMPSLSVLPEEEALMLEVEKWKSNYIDVSNSRHEILQLENRNSQLRQEVDRLNLRIATAEKDSEKLTKAQSDLRTKSERYRERAAELQDLLNKLTTLYRERTGDDPRDELNLDDATHSIDRYGTVHASGSTQRPSLSSTDTIDGKGVVPAVPPPPPAFLSKTVRQKVATPRVNLPLLNWNPVFAVRGTIFENTDDEARLREIDFSELEEEFKLPARQESLVSKQKRERAMDYYTSRISFVEPNRAKNMIITKTRVAKSVQQRLYWEEPLTSRDIKDAIESCDLNILPGEYAELLLAYIPTKAEVKKLAQHASQYSQMGEAEQFLFQLAQVERLEAKLGIMAFIGMFDELVETVKPKITCIESTSRSISSSVKLKKIFEIILAYGNYMNSGKRGYALGFRLDSLHKLLEVKSHDRKKTLLHHIVDIIDKSYPELSEFYTDIDINVQRGVSYQSLAEDILGLRKGIDMIKYEIERQPDNAIIKMFHARASAEVAEIAEMFRRMEDSYKSVCSKFSERYREVEIHEFFKHFSKFMEDFKVAQRENILRAKPPAPISPRFISPRQKSAEYLRRITQSEPTNLNAIEQQPSPTQTSSVPVSQQNGQATPLSIPRPKSTFDESNISPKSDEPIYATVQRSTSKTSANVDPLVTRVPSVKESVTVKPLVTRAPSMKDSKMNGNIAYVEPVTKVVPPRDNADQAPTAGAKNAADKAPVFSNQVEEALGSLDQVLDDALEEGTQKGQVAESSYL